MSTQRAGTSVKKSYWSRSAGKACNGVEYDCSVPQGDHVIKFGAIGKAMHKLAAWLEVMIFWATATLVSMQAQGLCPQGPHLLCMPSVPNMVLLSNLAGSAPWNVVPLLLDDLIDVTLESFRSVHGNKSLNMVLEGYLGSGYTLLCWLEWNAPPLCSLISMRKRILCCIWHSVSRAHHLHWRCSLQLVPVGLL